MFGPTGQYRAYYDPLGDPLEPLDDSPWEAKIVACTAEAIARAALPPFAPALQQAFADTARVRAIVKGYLPDYATEIEGDALPSWWGADG